ncbi:hypothetical protein F4778DRAFT_764349 [Xylariomycetidae sp. FL2044]|nr:hypothetical protein F4778DRAFT_764349 [Xylariomycetidae sp. FL2044]
MVDRSIRSRNSVIVFLLIHLQISTRCLLPTLFNSKIFFPLGQVFPIVAPGRALFFYPHFYLESNARFFSALPGNVRHREGDIFCQVGIGLGRTDRQASKLASACASPPTRK